MKRFNFFKYTTLGNKVDTTYFDYWYFKKLVAGGTPAPTEPVEGEGTEFTLSPTSNKKLAVVSLKGDTSQIGEPTPDNPQDVNVVTGTQTLTITNGIDEQTYPITLGSVELCKIGTYQDYIYKTGDKWYVRKEIGKEVLTGTEQGWSTNTSGGIRQFILPFPMSVAGTTTPLLSDKFIKASNLPENGFYINSGGSLVFRNPTSNGVLIASTTADWKIWLSTNNALIYYPLATPTDTEITEPTLLADLNALLSSGYLKKGTNTIKTTSTGTNLPTIIYIKSN